MQLFHHTPSIRERIKHMREQGKRVAFVPTMGNLHQGHISLVNMAQQHCDVVVVSIFVNRLQFGLNEDWDTYPRTLDDDAAKLKMAGCDMLFCPDEHEIYPNGMDSQARVIVPTMSTILCGASRPGHFDGVTTVVSKLFNIVQPDVAVFGLKDYQQLAIIRRMAEDLCMPIDIIGAPIARESDGLAMSSRNSFITSSERVNANQLYLSLQWLRTQLLQGRQNFSELEEQSREQIRLAGFTPDYIRICDSRTLEPAANDDLDITILGAMYTEKARLIDNISLSLTELPT